MAKRLDFRTEATVRKMLCGAAVLFLSACGDDAPKCELPSGAWQVTYRETSGDCGVTNELDQLVPFTGKRADLLGAPPGCTGTRSLSEDNCEWTISVECSAVNDDGTTAISRNVAEINFVADDRFEGVAERSFSAGNESCESQFEVIGTPR